MAIVAVHHFVGAEELGRLALLGGVDRVDVAAQALAGKVDAAKGVGVEAPEGGGRWALERHCSRAGQQQDHRGCSGQQQQPGGSCSPRGSGTHQYSLLIGPKFNGFLMP